MFPENYECEGQLNVFDYLERPYKITNPIRLIELFAGVGSQAMALKAIGAKFEHWKVVEFDKYAIASYNAIHGTDFPTIDITTVHGEDLEIVDTDRFTYLLTRFLAQICRLQDVWQVWKKALVQDRASCGR